MTKLLDRAFARASRLPKAEQEAFARWLLDEIDSDERWRAAFAAAPTRLAELADEALVEHRAGKTRKLVPGRL